MRGGNSAVTRGPAGLLIYPTWGSGGGAWRPWRQARQLCLISWVWSRSEAWALLLIHNITATAAAQAAGSAGLHPGLIPFTAVLGLIRSHLAADTCFRHRGHRPASADDTLASLNAAILRHRTGRQRTSGRTTAERRSRHTEEVTYTIDITKSNLPQWT